MENRDLTTNNERGKGENNEATHLRDAAGIRGSGNARRSRRGLGHAQVQVVGTCSACRREAGLRRVRYGLLLCAKCRQAAW